MKNIFNDGKPLSMQEKNKKAILLTLQQFENKIIETEKRIVEMNAFVGTVLNRLDAVEQFQNQTRVQMMGHGASVGG